MYLKYEGHLLPMKPYMAAILDLFLSETSKITSNFRNKFSIKNHIEMRYFFKIYVY